MEKNYSFKKIVAHFFQLKHPQSMQYKIIFKLFFPYLSMLEIIFCVVNCLLLLSTDYKATTPCSFLPGHGDRSGGVGERRSLGRPTGEAGSGLILATGLVTGAGLTTAGAARNNKHDIFSSHIFYSKEMDWVG